MQCLSTRVGRPSRIRYVKKFENLDLKVVNEYLDDALEVPEARQDLLDFIDSLTISTIDILKTIVNEVNIHGIEGLKKAKSFFNVVTNEYEYSCIRGYAYTGEIEQDKNKFSIENFSKAVERFNNPIPKPIVDDEDNCTIEERKALNEYYEYRRHNFHSLSYNFIYSSTKFSNLKVGDDFYNDEIIAIDKKLNVIVTKDGGEINYWWIKDPNSKPSLYRTGRYDSLVLKNWGASLPFMSGCLSGLRERSAKPCFVGSNPTPDSTLIYLPMDRKLRRELSKRKWISRAKKVYNSCGKFYIPVNGIKASVQYNVPIFRNRALRICESITDFLNDSKYAKMLKNCTSPYRSKMMQYEYKKENRKDRYKAKKDIQEGIQEYESRDNLSCSSCIFYDGGLCEKGLLTTDDCPEYWD